VAEARLGDRVRVHYRGSLKDGTEFDSSFDGAPLEFTLGEGMVIPGFENAVIGMADGERKTVSLSPDEGYGPYSDELIAVIQRSMIPAEIEPEVGMQLEAKGQDGAVTVVTIKEVADNTVTLDANHELAGKELVFEIQLVEAIAD
jgi:peptidylprolyl isomerase